MKSFNSGLRDLRKTHLLHHLRNLLQRRVYDRLAAADYTEAEQRTLP